MNRRELGSLCFCACEKPWLRPTQLHARHDVTSYVINVTLHQTEGKEWEKCIINLILPPRSALTVIIFMS